MHPEEEPVSRIAAALAQRFGPAPRVALVLGSGLGVLVDRLRDVVVAPSVEIGLPVSTVAGHAGRVVRGMLGETPVVALSGRVHLYEGYPPAHTVRFVRAAHRWGVQRLLLTCSAGGITDGLDPGSLLAISDHINLQNGNPLVGPAWGTRFPDLSDAYSPEMRRILVAAGNELDIAVHQGVYAAMQGPGYETPAEIRMLRAVGADVVGMSTVPEILAAAEAGLVAAALAVVSNRAAGLSETPLTHEEVTVIAERVGARVADLLEVAVARF